jgi:Carboxypeptidase regulatory-like domain/TonB dependent receptor
VGSGEINQRHSFFQLQENRLRNLGGAMKTSRRRGVGIALMCAAMVVMALSAPAGRAQTFRGSILGTVTDSSGAAIVNAKVTIRNVDTGVERSTETTADGGYIVPELPVGTYDIIAEMTGFEKTKVTGVTVVVAAERRVDMTLKAGAVNQQVVVTGESVPVVETSSDTLGGGFESQAVESLPINGRDYTKLLILVPGATGEPNGGGDSPGSYGQFSVNGSRGRANNYLLDGTDMNDGYRNLPAINQGGVFGTPGTILPEDSILELNVLSNTEAEFGRNSGSVVDIITKSGGNTFHGSAFEDFRNAVLNARNAFNDVGTPKDAFRNNQFGGTIGGPIAKNKLFFYGSYEGQREGMAITSINDVPTLNDGIAGDPNDYSQALSALTGTTVSCTTTVIACIDANSNVINPTILNLYNLCNSNGHCSGFNNVWPLTRAIGGPASNNLDSGIVKIDYNMNIKNQISGRYFFGNSHQSFPLGVGGGNNLPNTNTDAPIRTQLVSLSWVRTVSPEKVNEARFGWNRYRNGFYPEDASIFGDPNVSLGINTLDLLGPNTALPRDFGLPTIEVSGLAHLGSSGFSNPRNRVDQNYQFFDNFSWKINKHDVKFGGEYRRTTVNSFNDLLARGELEFNSLAEFLGGGLDGGTENFGNTSRIAHQNFTAFYVQDSYHMTSQLTVNLGLRWDYFGVISTEGDQLSIYSPTVGLVRPGQLYPKDLNNFSPRVSLAYDVFGKGKTVVRTGFGVFYDAFSQDFFTGQLAYNTDNTGPAYNPIGPNPVFITYALNPALPAGTGPLAGDSIIQPGVPIFDPASVTPGTATSTDAFTVSHNLRTPYVYNYNLNIQQEILHNTVLEVGYVGSAGRKLFHFLDINQPTQAEITAADLLCNCINSVFNTQPVPRPFDTAAVLSPLAPNQPFYVNQLQTSANSNYNSLQISLTQRNWHGFNNQVAYTWSHSIDTASDGQDFVPNASQPNDSTNANSNKGNSNFDTRNRFVLTSTYDVPAWHALGKFGSGWALSGVATVLSGHPFSLNYDFEGDFDGSGEGFGRPDIVGPIQYNRSNPADFLNLTSFAVPCNFVAVGSNADTNCMPGTRHFGNEGRNSLLGPNYRDLDFAISKTTSITERWKVQFRTDFYNVFNHPAYASPLLPAFFADAGFNGISDGTPMTCGPAVTLGRSCGFYPLTATSDVGLGNPVLGGGGARSIQFAVKFLF